MAEWTFLTNHAHVLLCIARDTQLRLREIADRVGITERAAQRIVAELVDAGYLARHRNGRRNHYTLETSLPMRHPVEAGHPVSRLVEAFAPVPEAVNHS